MESRRDEQLETTPEKNHNGSRQSRQATSNFASELGLAHPREEEQWRKIEKRQGSRNNADHAPAT
jgi:hypothetical protein